MRSSNERPKAMSKKSSPMAPNATPPHLRKSLDSACNPKKAQK